MATCNYRSPRPDWGAMSTLNRHLFTWSQSQAFEFCMRARQAWKVPPHSQSEEGMTKNWTWVGANLKSMCSPRARPPRVDTRSRTINRREDPLSINSGAAP